MSCAYQYGVETTAQPAAIANVSAPEAICSRPLYGVTKTSVAASRSAISSTVRKRSSNSTWSSRPRSTHRLLERQAVLLALAVRDVRVRPAGDHVEHLGMALDDRRQRLDHRLDPLARPRSARTSRAGTARRGAVRRRASRRRCRRRAADAIRRPRARASNGRRAVRHDPNLVCGARSDLDEQPSRRLGHHDHQLAPGGRAPRAPPPDAASAPRARCAASRRAAATAPRRARGRTRRRAPPKIPYSCWSRTTSTSRRPRIRAART